MKEFDFKRIARHIEKNGLLEIPPEAVAFWDMVMDGTAPTHRGFVDLLDRNPADDEILDFLRKVTEIVTITEMPLLPYIAPLFGELRERGRTDDEIEALSVALVDDIEDWARRLCGLAKDAES